MSAGTDPCLHVERSNVDETRPASSHRLQRREAINTQQRFRAWRDAFGRAQAYRGSMVWSETKGHSYLMRVAYDRQGVRRQSSLGPRSSETEKTKEDFERARDEASQRLLELKPVMERQAAVNRALGLGRVPLLGARIMRALVFAVSAFETDSGFRLVEVFGLIEVT